MIQRIITLPFFMGISLIAALGLWVKWWINYIKFGGECITYTKNNQRKTTKDIYDKLNETKN